MPPEGVNVNACRSEWETYIRRDISSALDWRRKKRSEDESVAVVDELSVMRTKTMPFTKTVWENTTTLCGESAPRVRSVSETVSIYMAEEAYASEEYADAINPWGEALPQYPTCTIEPSSCSSQWTGLQSAFLNWTIRADDVYWFGDESQYCDLTGDDLWCNQRHVLDLDHWMVFRGYPQHRGFFGNCPQVEQVCLANMGKIGRVPQQSLQSHEPNPASKWSCFVGGSRFVLIYFPPMGSGSSSSCGDMSVPEPASPPDASLALPTNLQTAVLRSIVFPSRHVSSNVDQVDNFVSAFTSGGPQYPLTASNR